MNLRTANLTRYILPLREGGSLPALAEADDDFKYVVKFKGSGHREKSVIAELLGGEIARRLSARNGTSSRGGGNRAAAPAGVSCLSLSRWPQRGTSAVGSRAFPLVAGIG